MYNASWACPLYKLDIPHVAQSDAGTYYCSCSLFGNRHYDSDKAWLKVKKAASSKSTPPLIRQTPYPASNCSLELDTTHGKFQWEHIIGAAGGSFVAGCSLCVLINRVWVIWKRGATRTIGAPGASLTEARSAPTVSSDKSLDDYTGLNFEMKDVHVYDDVPVSSK